jgi:hypothetical protein
VVAAELHPDPSVFLSERIGPPQTARSVRVRRVRWSAVAYLALGIALASIAIACATGTITRLTDALPVTVHVAHPIRYGFMYLWFASLSFFAAWFTATQERLPN